MIDNILFVCGTHDENTLLQLKDVASRAKYAAIMADGHLGYIMPVGGVAAYDNAVSVAGIGFDIACGNAAIRTNLQLENLSSLNDLADEIQQTISFGIGRNNNANDAPTTDPLFDSSAWDILRDIAKVNTQNLKDKARLQLGTVGSGNHYVDVFTDETGYVWVGVHFGSRGFGHGIASGFMALAQNESWDTRVKETEALLDLESDLGIAYWELMQLAGQYAYVGREWVARKVVSLLGGVELELVHNHHNFAWKETHFNEEVVVVRKGATPAFPNQKGFVGGSMGDNAVILRGANPTPITDSGPDVQAWEDQRSMLFSTVHGAGRVMSRTEAAGKIHRKTGRVIKPGKVSHDEMQDWLSKENVILRGGGLDESPHAYRRLPDVLSAQGATVEILHTLKPIIVVMAGADTYDPYKD